MILAPDDANLPPPSPLLLPELAAPRAAAATASSTSAWATADERRAFQQQRLATLLASVGDPSALQGGRGRTSRSGWQTAAAWLVRLVLVAGLAILGWLLTRPSASSSAPASSPASNSTSTSSAATTNTLPAALLMLPSLAEAAIAADPWLLGLLVLLAVALALSLGTLLLGQPDRVFAPAPAPSSPKSSTTSLSVSRSMVSSLAALATWSRRRSRKSAASGEDPVLRLLETLRQATPWMSTEPLAQPTASLGDPVAGDQAEELPGDAAAAAAHAAGGGAREPCLRVSCPDLVDPRTQLLNSAEPVRFENDMFEGVCLFRVRTSDPPPATHQEFWARWPKRMLEVGVQGRFKRSSDAVVYFGTAVPGWRFKASVTVLALCRLGLRFASGVVPGLMSSLGNRPPKELAEDPLRYDIRRAPANIEPPHIMMPLACAADILIETPPGQQPPPIQELGSGTIPGNLASKKNGAVFPIRTDCVYSFGYWHSNLDLEAWGTRNLPFQLDFRSYLQDRPIELLAYELVDPELRAPHLHAPANQKRCFSFTIQNLNAGATRTRRR